MAILNSGFDEKILINDLQAQTKFMFTTASLMNTGGNHFPDEELKLFYRVIKANIPNIAGISFHECSGDHRVPNELKRIYWDSALQNNLIDKSSYLKKIEHINTY